MHNSGISVSEPSDNCSVNYVLYKGDYYVSSENICMHKVDPETLETKEKVGRWDEGAGVQVVQNHTLLDQGEFQFQRNLPGLQHLSAESPCSSKAALRAGGAVTACVTACLGTAVISPLLSLLAWACLHLLAEQETTFFCVREKVNLLISHLPFPWCFAFISILFICFLHLKLCTLQSCP